MTELFWAVKLALKKICRPIKGSKKCSKYIVRKKVLHSKKLQDRVVSLISYGLCGKRTNYQRFLQCLHSKMWKEVWKVWPYTSSGGTFHSLTFWNHFLVTAVVTVIRLWFLMGLPWGCKLKRLNLSKTKYDLFLGNGVRRNSAASSSRIELSFDWRRTNDSWRNVLRGRFGRRIWVTLIWTRVNEPRVAQKDEGFDQFMTTLDQQDMTGPVPEDPDG